MRYSTSKTMAPMKQTHRLAFSYESQPSFEEPAWRMKQMKQKEWSKRYASTRIVPVPAHSKHQSSVLSALALRCEPRCGRGQYFAEE